MNRWLTLLLIICGGLLVNQASRADRAAPCSVCTPQPAPPGTALPGK